MHCQDGLREKLGSGEIPAEVKDAPFVQIPLGVTEDRLVGTVDIEASMKVMHSSYRAQPAHRCAIECYDEVSPCHNRNPPWGHIRNG